MGKIRESARNRDRAGVRILIRRGLPPAVPGQEGAEFLSYLMQNDISIRQVTHVTQQLVDDMGMLVAQLGPKYPFVASVQKIEEVIRCPTNTLLVAFNQDDRAIGMLLMISFPAVTGTKTWIEDVVVDERYRRQGVATMLFTEILFIARNRKITHINLSVRPRRIEANQLYEKLGFTLHDTNYYRYVLED